MQRVTALGAQIPLIGLGTAGLVGERARTVVRRGLELGYRHIDTAQSYDNEVEVGEAVRTCSIPREDIFVTTKVWVDRFAQGDLERSVGESLERLQLDAVDLVLLHWPNPKYALEETVRALSRVRRLGLAREIGLSNFPVATMIQALAAADEPLAAIEVEFHPFLDQRGLLDVAADHELAVIAHTPLARGRVLDDPTIRSIAARNERSPAQVALRWLLQHRGVAAVPGCTSEEHLEENLAVFEFALSADDVNAISGLRSRAGRILEWPELVPRWEPDTP
jgi:diketogulonate reductase-like aldo/keto reductase